MAEKKQETETKKKSGPTPKGTKRKKYKSLSKDEIKDIIEKKMTCKECDVQKTYKQSQATDIKLNAILGKRYLPANETTPTPPNYFNPKSLKDKVLAVMFDMGYVLSEDE